MKICLIGILSLFLALVPGARSTRAQQPTPRAGLTAVTVLGDSISSLNTWGFPVWAQLLPAAIAVHDLAASGATTSTILASQWPQTTGSKTVVIYGGSNDLGDGVTWASTQANLLTLAQQIQAAGAAVVFVTPLPRATFSGFEQQLRTFVLGLGPQFGAPVVDPYPAFNNGAGGLSAAYDSGDGIHPNAAGQQVLEQLIGAVLDGSGTVINPVATATPAATAVPQGGSDWVIVVRGTGAVPACATLVGSNGWQCGRAW